MGSWLHRFAALLALLWAFPAVAAWQPGLQVGKFSPASSVEVGRFPAETNVSLSIPHAKAGATWGGNTVWVYWGQIHLDGSTYRFGENIDDMVWLAIDGQVILNDTDWDGATFGSIRRPAGWYSFELRFQNGGGGAGPVEKAGFTADKGFCYRKGSELEVGSLTDPATFVVPEEPGDKSFFRYDDGLGFGDTLVVSGTPASVGEVVPPYGEKTGLAEGAAVACSAPSTVTEAGSSYSLLGYEVHDLELGTQARTNLVASGTTGALEYVHGAGQRELVWRWRLDSVEISISSGTGGSVSTQGGVFDAGARVEVTATPADGYAFSCWEGITDAELRSRPVLSFTATVPLNLTARFKPVYYVAVDGDDTRSGLSPELALAKVSTAIARARENGAIVIALPGVHAVDGELLLAADIQVRGSTGRPEDVILRRPDGAEKYRVFHLDHPAASVSDLTIEGGYAYGNYSYGGGARISSNGGRIFHCIIRNCRNAAKWSGGAALYLDSDRGVVSRCIVSNNVSSRQGDSGAYTGSGLMMARGTVENSLFAYNETTADNASHGHVVTVYGGTLVNCTIVRNKGLAVAGVYAKEGTRILNCLIEGNTSPSAKLSEKCWGGDAAAFRHCAMDLDAPVNDQCLAGEGFGFADLQGGDFHLTAGSPCIDAASGGTSLGALDLDGNPRVSGAEADIGCYEFDLSAFSVGCTAAPVVSFAPSTVTLTATATGVTEGDVVDYAWRVSTVDGTVSIDGEGAVFRPLCSVPGTYDVTLSAVNRTSGKEATLTLPAAFIVGAKTLYVVPENPGATPPYATWETAATTVQEAVDAAMEGAEVVVSNGVYLLKSQVALEKEITLRGLTGRPEDVVLRRDPKTRSSRIMMINAGAGALVHGLTLSDGNFDGSAGLYLHSKGGTVSNCVIRNAFCYYKWARGGGFVLDSDDGLITHCVISNNTSSAGWGEGSGTVHGTAGDVRKGRLEHSLLTGNYPDPDSGGSHRQTLHVEAGAVRFCTIAGNVSTNCAGVNCLGGSIEHCVIAGNRSNRPEPAFAVWGSIKSAFGGNTDPSVSNNFVRCISDVAPINAGCLQAEAESLFESAGEREYDLRRGSPAVDRVDPLEAGEMPSVDLAGRPRLAHRRYDLGCYEQIYVTPGTVLFLR